MSFVAFIHQDVPHWVQHPTIHHLQEQATRVLCQSLDPEKYAKINK